MAEKMSQESLEKMKSKLAELKGRRAKLSKTIGEARDEGDIKENAGYHAAKEDQGLNEMRIRELESKIANAVVVDVNEGRSKDKVSLGSTVKIKDLDSGREDEYTIVPAIDADVLEGKISTESPIGEALLGAAKGEVFEVEVPAGTRKYQVLSIK